MDNNDPSQRIFTKMYEDLREVSISFEESQSKRSIYRIPAHLREENKKACYEPQLVSLGPYHHGSVNLKPMEIHKKRALLRFVERSKKSLADIFALLQPLLKDLRDAYDQLGDPWETDDQAFLELMIMDGCFVLEILTLLPTTITDTKSDANNNDPIFSLHGIYYAMPTLTRDMLILENQLPLLLLWKLYALQNTQERMDIFVKQILVFMPSEPEINDDDEVRITDDDVDIIDLHLLGIYRRTLLLHDDPPPHNTTEKPAEEARSETNVVDGRHTYSTINLLFAAQASNNEIEKELEASAENVQTIKPRSAADLKEAGVKIKKSKTSSIKDISFENGILMLPEKTVDDFSESLYLNLLAFERAHVGVGNEVSSYICFMDEIIDTPRDVSLLRSANVIENLLGSDEAVATMFNSLGKNVTMSTRGPPLGKVREQMDAYCRQPWHKWRSNLMHTYFANPWVALSVVAAFFLFAFTAVQTAYTIRGYYNN